MYSFFYYSFHLFQFKAFQFPFQRRVVSSVKFLRETARKVIEVRKSAMKRGEQVPDDILRRIIEQGLLTHAAELFYAGFAGTQPYPTYCLHLLISSFIQSLTHRLTHSFIYSFIHSFILHV